jgi:hypothetical protein
MSAEKKKKTSKQSDAGEIGPIARAAFDEAIATCARRWKERWDRAPTTNELVHAFEICLMANPDAYVDDVGPVLAMSATPPRAAPAIDVGAFEVAFRDKGKFGVDEAEIYLRKNGLAKPGYGEVQVHLEIAGDTLLADVELETHRQVPTFAQACTLVRERVLHRFIGRKDVVIARVVLRPMTGLADPLTLPWPPPEGA